MRFDRVMTVLYFGLMMDVLVGVGPINLTIGTMRLTERKLKERKLKRELGEGSVAIIYTNSTYTKGYVYKKEDGKLLSSIFNEIIGKPKWYTKVEESL